MYCDAIAIKKEIVQQFLKNQFPDQVNLPLSTIGPEGTDNAMYKLGKDKVI